MDLEKVLSIVDTESELEGEIPEHLYHEIYEIIILGKREGVSGSSYDSGLYRKHRWCT